MQALLAQLQQQLGSQNLLTGSDISERYQHDWSADQPGQPIAVARPASTEEVSEILRLCARAGQAVVVQGGLTGLCGGGIPQAGELAISLDRCTGIEELDRDSMTMTVRAGTPLQVIQQAADEAGFFFPLDLGARGTCNIGGNIATNAGGNQVVRFGMTRNLVLGLEAVLADGTVISSLNKMLKNNAGYDLKHLFIGSEGTLGIVTRAVLRLFPKSSSRCSGLLAVTGFDQIKQLLRFLSARFGGSLSTFEVMWAGYYHYITDHVEKAASPFNERYPLYVLTEMEGADAQQDQEKFENTLARAMEEGMVADAVLARSDREREGFWRIRDGVGEIGGFIRNSANFDISLPIARMEPFLEQIQAELQEKFANCTILVFGHVGDSNLHIISATGRREDVKPMYEVVYSAVGEFAGSVSAEHGIGMQKRKYLPHSRSEQELELMRRLKQALDPQDILNRGRVLG